MPEVNPMVPFDNRVPPPVLPDMFGRMEQMANIRNLMNQNNLFQQTFQAKQKAGQIMATAPDVNTGLQRLQADPTTAAFAPELMNTYRQLDLTNTQVQSNQQTMYSSGMHSVMQALPSAYTDMSSFDKAMGVQIGTLSPMTQQYLKDTGAIQSLRSAMFDDLPKDQKAAQQAYKMRWNALMLGAGFSPEAIQQITSKPSTVEAGGKIYTGTTAPGIFGGGFTEAPVNMSGQGPAYGGINKTLPPTVAQVGNVPLILDQASGAQQTAPNALGVQTPGTGAPAAPAQKAGDGKPLIPSAEALTAPGITELPSRMNPTGLPVLSTAQQEASQKLSEAYGGSEKHAFDNANTTLSTLEYMDADYDKLATSPNKWLTPGFAGKARTSLANLANTVTQMVSDPKNVKLPVPAENVASAESFIKATRYLGLQVLTTMLGNQREAAQTIQNITEAVPSIDNTYLGGKVLIDTIKAQTQRVIDERNWDNAWIAKNKTLLGAAEAFNAAHPPEQYAQTVLSKYGLNSKGFSDPRTVIQLAQQGYLDKAQAKAILDKQFPGGPAKHLPQAPTPAASANAPNGLGATP